MLLAVIAALWRVKDDRSFEAVCLFSLLGLALSFAVPGLIAG
ncbi:MAG: hypothetical protein WCA56_18350 [Xanthobacteraceae bacterium]|jgi:hypothetical protein